MKEVKIGELGLSATLTLPSIFKGVVVFAHGSGSSRLSPRNRAVAKFLNAHSFGTLLLDLLTKEEDEIDNYTRQYRFDIPLLAKRLVEATQWILEREKNVGYFGASTGAAAALIAAEELGSRVQAVVSRGGRPDLAGSSLYKVYSPTLLIVGSQDQDVLLLNQEALEKIPAEKKLLVIEGATHLFEEEGALEQVAEEALHWFNKFMTSSSSTGEKSP